MDDPAGMAEWLDRLRRKMTGDDERTNHVRRLFVEAYRARAKLELTEPSGPDPDRVITASIEQVGHDHLIINQPSVGGLTVPLPKGCSLRASFLVGTDRWSCRTRCLGRAKIASGGGAKMLYGYRLAMPDEINHSIKQRARYRIRVGIELAPSANLIMESPEDVRIEGIIDDLSEGGLLITTEQSLSSVRIMQVGIAHIALPEPIGQTKIGVTVRHIRKRGNYNALGVEFEHEIPGLRELIRSLEIKQGQRARSA